MKNKSFNITNIPKKNEYQKVALKLHYSNRDLYDLASLAESDMNWMHTALSEIQLKIKQIQTKHPNIKHHFNGLEKILEMYVYLAENRQQYHADEAQKHALEFQANKKVEIL